MLDTDYQDDILPNNKTDFPINTDNMILDFMSNTKVVLDNDTQFTGITDIFITGDKVIISYPYIVIKLNNLSEEWKTPIEEGIEAPTKRTVTVSLYLFLYYELINANLEVDILIVLNRIVSVLRVNWDLNGYCDLLGVLVSSASLKKFTTDDNKLVSGAIINLNCKKVIEVAYPF